MILPRRKFLIGAAAILLAAPAIVRYESLMRVKPLADIIYTINGSRHLITDLSLTTSGDEQTLSFWFSENADLLARCSWRYISQHVSI